MTATTRHERSGRHGSGRCSRVQLGSFPFGSCLSLQSADGRTAQWTPGPQASRWASGPPRVPARPLLSRRITAPTHTRRANRMERLLFLGEFYLHLHTRRLWRPGYGATGCGPHPPKQSLGWQWALGRPGQGRAVDKAGQGCLGKMDTESAPS